jgi:hypothetical protein
MAPNIFGPNKVEVTKDWRKLHNTSFIILTLRLITLGLQNQDWWAENVERIYEVIISYKILARNLLWETSVYKGGC